MDRNLKHKIQQLKQEGKTIREIKMMLGCSYSTIAYHLYEKTKKSTHKRIQIQRQNPDYYRKPNTILSRKFQQFFRIGRGKHKMLTPRTFKINELKNIINQNPVCYISGDKLNFSDSASYSLDHKMPLSRGGESVFQNLGVCSWKANKLKGDMTLDELIDYCQQILRHHGYEVKNGGRNGELHPVSIKDIT